MKKGDLVKYKGEELEDVYVIVKGPYESACTLHTGVIELSIVVDIYCARGIVSNVSIDLLKVVGRF